MAVNHLESLNPFFSLSQEAKDGELLRRCIFGECDDIFLLIKAGANVNAIGKEGNTVLMYAANCGHIRAAAFLIQAGAKLEAVNHKGQTALTHAILFGGVDLIFLFFSVMTEKKIDNEIRLQQSNAGKNRTDLSQEIKVYAEAFQHTILKKTFTLLGPIFLNQRKENSFSFLPLDLKRLIYLNVSLLEKKALWIPFRPEVLTFSWGSESENSPKPKPPLEKDIIDEINLDKLSLVSDKDRDPKHNKKRCIIF